MSSVYFAGKNKIMFDKGIFLLGKYQSFVENGGLVRDISLGRDSF